MLSMLDRLKVTSVAKFAKEKPTRRVRCAALIYIYIYKEKLVL